MTTEQKQIAGQRERYAKKVMQALHQLRKYWNAGKRNKLGISELPEKYLRKYDYWKKQADLFSKKFTAYRDAYRKTFTENN